MSTPRFNLRNASLFLSKLKTKYSHNKSQQNRDNTFIDEQEQISSSNPSMSKKCSQKLDSVTDRLFENNQDEDINVKSITQKSVQKKQKGHQQNIRQTFETTQQSQSNKRQTQFCDLIVIKYLEQTLTVYKADLQTLQHNRQNLQQQIYFLGKKIGKLHEMAAQNKQLEEQIGQLNQQLKLNIAKYHESNKILWRQKMQLGKVFNRERNKLKKLLFLGKQDCQNTTQNYFKINSYGEGYVDKYLEFLEFKKEQKRQINERLKLDKQNKCTLNQQNSNLAQKIFKGKEQIYFRDHKKKLVENNQNKSEAQSSNVVNPIVEKKKQKKQKKVVLYDEAEHQAPQDSQKQKPKKLSEAQRAMLLGDLKNFSKSFKLPK